MKSAADNIKEVTFNQLAVIANDHLNHIIFSSKNKEDLFFKLSGYYGTLVEVLKEKKLLK